MSQEHAFYRSKTFNRRKIWLMFLAVFFVLMFLGGRLVYLMVFCSEYYGQKAEDLHERERDIKAARGRIIDATGKILATNKSVCTISVIHSQIDEPEKVIAALRITREFWGLKSNTIPICRERAARSSPLRMRAGLRLKMRERRGLSR